MFARRSRHAWVRPDVLVGWALTLGGVGPALAQTEPPAPAALVAPQLVEAPAADYPPGALPERLSASVVLRLLIDAEGRVAEADVIEAAGHGFDEAARAAALRLRFNPARRGTRPIAARISYSVRFEPPREKEPPLPTFAVPVPPREPQAQAGALVVKAEPSAAATTEVTVSGQVNDGRKLQQSAEAVNVIDTRRAQQQTADLGEVLARSQGVAVRRDGGLGSASRFSLNGLYDDQVRFFLDGVPLDVAGYPLGVANVPVNLVSRVEVYRGVVPIRFGTDALGGAVNLATAQSYRTHAAASYQVGSFGTHRLTANGRYLHEPSGFVLGAAAFWDRALNNYEIDVRLTDRFGQVTPARIRRFHDRYAAYGANIEVGVVNRPWARKLLLSGYSSGYSNEIQNNVVMTVPYGEATSNNRVVGTTARYEISLREGLDLDLVASYAHGRVQLTDVGSWVYDWLGRRVSRRQIPGEIDGKPTDQVTWSDTLFGRAGLAWRLGPAHTLRFATSTTYTIRTGDQRQQLDPNARDLLNTEDHVLRVVSGVEYELTAFAGRLSNIVLVKDYLYRVDAQEPLFDSGFRTIKHASHTLGTGDALRYRFSPWLYAKVSYEYATRLPTPGEVFGNGLRVHGNTELKPELSNNFNLGPRMELKGAAWGNLMVDVNGFLRVAEQQIQELGNDRASSYQNVYSARSVGLENAASWSPPARWLTLSGTFTYQDLRNTSNEGQYAKMEGDRIPNRPYIFGSWGAQLRFTGLPDKSDTLEPFYNARYVHSFFRGWESQGLREFKKVIDSQVTHNAGVSWTVNRKSARITNTLEISNLTGAKVYDNYGVQRPGRAIYLKISGSI